MNKNELNIAPIKDKMIMVRFDPNVYNEIGRLAKANKTSRGKIVRALVDKTIVLSKMS